MWIDRFIRFCLDRRWIILIVFLFIGVFGYYSWKQLEIDAYPDIADVSSMVITKYPGHAAETVEEQVTIPLERALNGIPGLHVMRSKSTFGLSTITLVFTGGVDDYFARQLIRERLSEVDLPGRVVPGLEPLTSPTGEIYRYTLQSGTLSTRELREIQEWVVIPKLKEAFGVAEVINFGGETTLFHCEIDPSLLVKYGISLEQVIEAVDINNSNAGGGKVSRGDLSYVIRGIGLVRSLDDLGNIVVSSSEGTPVFLRDLGELKLGANERDGILGKDEDSDLVSGIVVLLRGQDPTSTLKNVHAKVNELNERLLPPGVQLIPYYDRTELIAMTSRKVTITLLQGIGLVLLILLLFLGSIRSALVVALVIPFAMLVAFALMHLTGIPANLLSLGALSFGILVDAAIVIVEALQGKREKSPSGVFDVDTISRSTSRVAKPVFFSVLIIVAAHLPLFAFERIEAKFFTPMAYTVAYALGGALLFSLAVIPGLMLWAYKKPSRIRQGKLIDWLKGKYTQLLGYLLDKPKRAIIPALLAILLTAVLFTRVGKEFLPYIDEGTIWLQVKLPAGISIEKASGMADEIRSAAREFPEVSFIVTQLGRNDEGTDPFTPSHIESMVGLKPYHEWNPRRGKLDLIAEMDNRFKQIPGITVGFSQPMIDGVNDKVAGAHSEIVIKVFGDDLTTCRDVATRVIQVLEGIEGAVDLAIDQEPPLPQMQVQIDREAAARYGINVSRVSELIEVGLGGREVSKVYLGQRGYDVILRFPGHARDTPGKIGNLLLQAPGGAHVALSQVAQIVMTTGESTISREMNRRHITVKVNLRGRDFASFLNEARATIEQVVPYDRDNIEIQWGGLFENKERAEGRAMVILPMVLGIIFLLLYAEFGTARHSLVILSSLPLAVLGGILALLARDMTINVASTVGFIALSGLAVQNGVILVSNINRVREGGMHALEDAVIRGSVARLRPVLITATTTLFGVLPAAFALGVGSDIQRPLTTVVMGGLVTATLLTLVVLPVLYYLVERKFGNKKVQDRK